MTTRVRENANQSPLFVKSLSEGLIKLVETRTPKEIHWKTGWGEDIRKMYSIILLSHPRGFWQPADKYWQKHKT